MAPSTLRIRLFGEVDLRRDGTPLPPLESARAESLLANLLLHREAPQPRHQLAFLLWPDSTESQARTNLRHVLHNLRRALPEPDRFLAVTPRTLRWRADAPFWLDVAAFDEAIARAGQESGDGLAALREAVALYAATSCRGATRSGSRVSARGSGSAIWRPSPGSPRCWKPAASTRRRSRTPRVVPLLFHWTGEELVLTSWPDDPKVAAPRDHRRWR